MKKWEYLLISMDDYSLNDINALGKQGWELITHSMIVHKNVVKHQVIFKREIK